MTPITFRVFGTPKGQPRPRAFAFNGSARVFDPGTAEGWKSQIALVAKYCLPEKPLDVPLRVDVAFVFPRPKGHYRGKSGELRATAPTYHIGKPDADNLAKAVFDALTTLGMWKDDSLIAETTIRKEYENGAKPGALITISALEPVISVTRGEG